MAVEQQVYLQQLRRQRRVSSVLLVEALGGLGGSAVNGLVLPMMSVHMKEEPRCCLSASGYDEASGSIPVRTESMKTALIR